MGGGSALPHPPSHPSLAGKKDYAAKQQVCVCVRQGCVLEHACHWIRPQDIAASLWQAIRLP